jgi:hypothetical protein
VGATSESDNTTSNFFASSNFLTWDSIDRAMRQENSPMFYFCGARWGRRHRQKRIKSDTVPHHKILSIYQALP